MKPAFARFAKACADGAGSPVTFVTVVALMLAWLVSGPLVHWSDTWQLVANTATTLYTTLLVLLVQNTQNRNDQALHVKLDELLVSLSGPDNRFAGIEGLTEDDLAVLERAVHAEAQARAGRQGVEP